MPLQMRQWRGQIRLWFIWSWWSRIWRAQWGQLGSHGWGLFQLQWPYFVVPRFQLLWPPQMPILMWRWQGRIYIWCICARWWGWILPRRQWSHGIQGRIWQCGFKLPVRALTISLSFLNGGLIKKPTSNTLEAPSSFTSTHIHCLQFILATQLCCMLLFSFLAMTMPIIAYLIFLFTSFSNWK